MVFLLSHSEVESVKCNSLAQWLGSQAFLYCGNYGWNLKENKRLLYSHISGNGASFFVKFFQLQSSVLTRMSKATFLKQLWCAFFCYSLRACSSHIYTDISVLDCSLTLADFSMNHRFSAGVERKYRRCVESHGRQTSRITTAHPSCIGIHEPSTDIVLTCFFPSAFSPNSLSFLTQTFRKFDSVFGFITDMFSISPTYACCWEDVGAERLSWGCLIRTLTCEQGF